MVELSCYFVINRDIISYMAYFLLAIIFEDLSKHDVWISYSFMIFINKYNCNGLGIIETVDCSIKYNI